MELDAMKAQWAEYDRKLDVTIRLNRQLLGAAKIGPGANAAAAIRGADGRQCVVRAGGAGGAGKFYLRALG